MVFTEAFLFVRHQFTEIETELEFGEKWIRRT